MKKIITAAVALLAMSLAFVSCGFTDGAAEPGVIPTEVTWSSSYKISDDVLKDTKAGTTLKITIEPDSGAQYINVGLVDGYWSCLTGKFCDENGKELDGGSYDGNTWATLKDSDGNYIKTLYYTVDSAMAAVLDHGLIMVGNQYGVKTVEVYSQSQSAENAAAIEGLEEKIEELESTINSLTSPVVKSVTKAELVKNSTFNNQAVLEILDTLNPYKASVGDKIKVTFKATADSVPTTTLKTLNAQLVDNTEVAGWWTTLCSQVSSKEISKSETLYEFEFEITTAATSTLPAACKLVLNFGGGDKNPVNQETAINLTISEFTFVKE